MFLLIGASLSLTGGLELFTRWFEQKWYQAILNKICFLSSVVILNTYYEFL